MRNSRRSINFISISVLKFSVLYSFPRHGLFQITLLFVTQQDIFKGDGYGMRGFVYEVNCVIKLTELIEYYQKN